MGGNDIYESSYSLMKQLEQRNNLSNYSAQWSKMSGGGRLEMKWQKSEPFRLLNDSVDEALSSVAGGAQSPRSVAQSLASDTKSVNYKDENDHQLSGEDLDSIIEGLKF